MVRATCMYGRVFWTKHDICITQKHTAFIKNLTFMQTCFHWESIRGPTTDLVTRPCAVAAAVMIEGVHAGG